MPVAAGLYYFAHEADNLRRPPVVLIHGAGGQHLSWPPQIRRLHDQRIFAVDLPGHGKSEGIGHHIIGDYGVEVIEFIKALKLNSAVLIGHSMGGAIALQIAVQHPKRVLGLGLLGSGARMRVSPSILQGAADPSTFEQVVHQINETSFAAQAGARLKEQSAQRLAETRPSVLYGDLLACEDFDLTEGLAKIAVPTLVLCGAEDRMMPPKNSEALREGIAKARLEILPEAGHMLMVEQPDRVAGLIEDFLGEIHFQPGK